MPLVCRIELNKHDGITVTVENPDDGIVQTLRMTGTMIELKCASDGDTSTITQECDSVAVECKHFSVDAQTVDVTSSRNTKHTARGTFSVDSTGDISVDGKANINGKAAVNGTMKATVIDSSATASTSIKAPSITVKGGAVLTAAAPMITVAADGALAASGAIVNVEGKGILNLKGAAATLEGQLTRIAGAIIKLG